MEDGRIAGRDHEWVQNALTVTVAMFRRMGLETNLEKTKLMVCTPGFIWGYGRGAGLQETGDGIRGNLQKTEEGKVELRHVQRDGGGVLS